MVLSGYKRPNVPSAIGRIPMDSVIDGEKYEKASSYYDKHRHLLVKITLNTSIALSTLLAFASGLRMWNLDISEGKTTGPNNYVILMFGFSSLCVIFMILINVFYTQILQITLSVNKQSTKL